MCCVYVSATFCGLTFLIFVAAGSCYDHSSSKQTSLSTGVFSLIRFFFSGSDATDSQFISNKERRDVERAGLILKCKNTDKTKLEMTTKFKWFCSVQYELFIKTFLEMFWTKTKICSLPRIKKTRGNILKPLKAALINVSYIYMN